MQTQEIIQVCDMCSEICGTRRITIDLDTEAIERLDFLKKDTLEKAI